MEEDKEEKITQWLIKNVFRNRKILYADIHDLTNDEIGEIIYELLEILASMHNEYYRMVWGQYYDYMGHWTNKEIGGWMDADLFKEM